MAGLTAAKLWPAPGCGLLAPALTATGLAAIAPLLATRTGRLNHVAWGLSLALTVSLGGFVMLHFREPQLHRWSTLPPREITLTVRLSQLKPLQPNPIKRLSGIRLTDQVNLRSEFPISED